MVDLGERRLQLQPLLINNLDPMPKRSWVKAKTHGRADARSLTANEPVKVIFRFLSAPHGAWGLC